MESTVPVKTTVVLNDQKSMWSLVFLICLIQNCPVKRPWDTSGQDQLFQSITFYQRGSTILWVLSVVYIADAWPQLN